MTKEEKQEFLLEVENLYDEYTMKTARRGISYGEIYWIENLSDKKLNEFYNELLEKLEEKESEAE